jgi:hypothetical protein
VADATPGTGSKSSLGFLARKIGPVPIWLIGVALIGAYYWYSHYGPGASASSSSTSDQIDPETGVSYASELGAAQQQLADLQSQQQGGTPPVPTGPQFTSADQSELAGLPAQEEQLQDVGQQAEKEAAVQRSQGSELKKLAHPAAKKPAAKKPAPKKPPAKRPGPVRKKATTRPVRTMPAAKAPAGASRWRTAA